MASTTLIPRCVYAMSFLLLLLLCAANGVLVRSRDERERCNLMEKQMNVRLKKFDDHLGQLLACRGQITVRYCEGSCRSKTLPSVESSNGEIRLCRCCFESHTRTVDVWLPHCRIHGGRHLSEGRWFEMNEPTNCHCARCSRDD